RSLAAIGADAVATLVAADERLQHFRHPLPKDVRWKKLLMIVVCARRYGLIASLTRIVCAGPLPEEMGRRTRAAAGVNAALLVASRPGVNGRELYEVATSAYRATGFPGEERLPEQGGARG